MEQQLIVYVRPWNEMESDVGVNVDIRKTMTGQVKGLIGQIMT